MFKKFIDSIMGSGAGDISPELMTEQARLVLNAVNATAVMVENLERGREELESVARAVHDSWYQARMARRRMLAALPQSEMLPFYRENYITLVQQIDRVAGAAESFARFLAIEAPALPPEIAKLMSELAGANRETFAPVVDMVSLLYNNPSKVVESADLIMAGERAVDNLEWNLQKKLKLHPEVDAPVRVMVSLLVTRLAAVAHLSEDVAETARIIVAKQA